MHHRDHDMRVVVSNGTNRFHLAPLAAELERRGMLSALVTGGYPKGAWARLLRHVRDARLRRLLARREDLPDARVLTCDASEVLFKAGDLLFGARWPEARQRVHHLAFDSYASTAARHLRRLRYDLYHYRNCFGGVSARQAREAGRKTLCDHSIGHPFAVSLIRRRAGLSIPALLPPQPLDLLEARYLADFEDADHYLVNSAFVKSTFVAAGIAAERVSVAYWGVDAKFLEAADRAAALRLPRRPATDLLFSGGFGARKGAFELMDALERLPDHPWTLTVAGNVESEAVQRWDRFRHAHPGRVQLLGFIDRDALARTMAAYRTFVFPSRMEGSARVVFEALASGCRVLTTPHAGSIVEDGIHGRLTPPGCVDALTAALEETFRQGGDLDAAGRRNAELVRDTYRQDQYADRVVNVYRKLLSA